MIYTENTPNPNAVKFISEKVFSEIGVTEFQKKDIKTINNNFIKNLLGFDGVELVLISEKFISVKKNDDINWDSLKPSIISLINDHFEKNKNPILLKTERKKNIQEKGKEDESEEVTEDESSGSDRWHGGGGGDLLGGTLLAEVLEGC